MKLTPRERAIHVLGHSDGERAKPVRSEVYAGSERDRMIYERGYGRGYDARYREDAAHKQHGNTGLPREARPAP